MAGNSASNNGNQDVVLNVNAEAPKKREVIKETEDCVPLLKKVAQAPILLLCF